MFDEIDIGKIRTSKMQPREFFDADAIAILGESIARHGVLQPLLVRKGEFFEIIAGERRYRAALGIGLKRLPCIILSPSQEEHLTLAIVENIQREDLNVVEEARAFARLISLTGCTHEEVAKKVGRNRASVTNSLRLLKLPDSLIYRLSVGDLDVGHAKALLGLSCKELLLRAADKIMREGMSVRQSENLVRSLNKGGGHNRKIGGDVLNGRADDGSALNVERAIEDAIGARTVIKKMREGEYCLEITFSSKHQLEGILEKMGVII